MKSVIVHDWLTSMSGAEKVVEAIYELYPSKMFTLFKDASKFKGGLFDKIEIETSFLQKMPGMLQYYRNLLPLFPHAIESFDLSDYDLILSSSHSVAKGVLPHGGQQHICYCHTPMRYAWDLYFDYMKGGGLKSLLMKPFLHRIRNWDVFASMRVDHFIANSECVAKRIKKIYRRDAPVIHPPVDTKFFALSEKPREDFYITAGRFVPYKKIDIIVEAFRHLPDKKLVVIGEGPEMNKIRSKAGKNVALLGFQKSEYLKEMLQKAKAFLFMANEDFGILPVEAQSCGTPVIAFGKGGALETVVENETGLFLFNQSASALADMIKFFERNQERFDPKFIRQHAESFSREHFQNKFQQFVEEKTRR